MSGEDSIGRSCAVGGEWFAVTGPQVTALLSAADRSRVASVWDAVDSGADFDAALDALLVGGFRSLAACALVGHGSETRVLVRGDVRVTLTNGQQEMVITGQPGGLFVDQRAEGVTGLRFEVPGGAASCDAPLPEGIVRVSAIAMGEYAEPVAEDDSPAPSPAPEPAPEPQASVETEAHPEADEQAPGDESAAGEAPAPDAAADSQVESLPETGPAPESESEAGAESEPAPDAEPEAIAGSEPPPEATPEPEPEASAQPEPEPPVAAPTETPEPPSSGEPGSADLVGDHPSVPAEPVDPPQDQSSAPAYQPEDHDGATYVESAPPEPPEPVGVTPGRELPPAVVAKPVAKLVFSTGEVVDVDRTILVGRAPNPGRFASSDKPQLVTVTSPNHEISSTHLEIRPGAGADHGSAVVTDLGSTNGTVLVQPGLPPEDLQAGIAVSLIPGAILDLGDGVTISTTNP